MKPGNLVAAVEDIVVIRTFARVREATPGTLPANPAQYRAANSIPEIRVRRIDARADNRRSPQDKLRGVVEADEVYIGGHQRGQTGHPNPETSNKMPAVTALERGGRVKPFHVERVTQKNLHRIVHETVDTSARLMTDKALGYRGLEHSTTPATKPLTTAGKSTSGAT